MIMWSEVYEHEDFGTIEVSWLGEQKGERAHLVALQSDLWTPVEEVESCIRWARNLQHEDVTRGGDAVRPLTL